MIAFEHLPQRTIDTIDGWNLETTTLRFRTYVLPPITEQGINYGIQKLCNDLGRPELQIPLYLIIKELAVNATKANLKAVYFRESGFNLADDSEYRSVMRKFHDLLSEEWARKYAELGKYQNLFVEISFSRMAGSLLVQVANSRPITTTELNRFRDKIKLAEDESNCENYVLNGGDSEEGAGMGLLMIINALKSIDVSASALSIRVEDQKKTSVLVRIPLEEKHDQQD